ncbi:MaoC family dehydratase [Sphingomonas colocasiae]|uniref:MaoC family dehydratase n=1 Tax=Sphingomonas colocasiae TaxID=1848973 RepID=A0ABS7PN58_9SPHN|nr:MaoC family dehydratase [Sphingomonas colocasiae]MBY8822745.1 MaoC family dehydratase [Sphingomonas colocasiae]
MQYFEDIEVGSKTQFGRYEVTRDEVIEFARKFDPQPFHLSDEAAAQTYFGRIAASGWHTASISMSMIVAHLETTKQAGLGGLGIDDLRWWKPVYPGDTLRCEIEILEKTESRSKPDRGTYRSRLSVFNQDGEKVMSYVNTALIRRRPTEG